MTRWLVVDLAAPLMSFGGVQIDQVGPTRDFPSASMLTGLFANALGWHWNAREQHQRLQDRLVFGARMDREPADRLTDVQNVQLKKNDVGWTTWGNPLGRDGATYNAPHRRMRDYLADARVRIVARLEPADEAPDLDTLAEALQRPARPLYIGRKPCLPACSLFGGFVEADKAYDALLALDAGETVRAQWPEGEGPERDGGSAGSSGTPRYRVFDICDERNWRSGYHAGSRILVQGEIGRPS